MIYEEEILSFITHFSQYGKSVVDCFTTGNCYWFAQILNERFGVRIMYNPVEGHFACNLNGEHLYDITGRIDTIMTGPWEDFYGLSVKDPTHFDRIYANCVEFEDYNENQVI